MYRLIFLTGQFKGRRLVVRQPSVTIGRDADCHVRLPEDDEVSRKHATLEERAEGVYLRDLGALNPTLVNGATAQGRKLEHGDVLEVGKTRIQYQEIHEPDVREKRRVSRTQGITFLAVIFIVILEIVILFGLSFWHSHWSSPAPTLALPIDAPSETPEPEAVETPKPEPPTPETEIVAQPVAEPPAPTPEPPPPPPEPEPEPPPPPEPEPAVAETEPAETVEPQPAETVEPQPSVPPEPEAAFPDDPVTVRAREMLAEAIGQIHKHNYNDAAQTLDRIHILAPDFVPAYAEHARLLESRGHLKRSGEMWARVMGLTAGTPLYAEAAAERIRIARLEQQRPAPSKPAKPVARARLPKRIRIANVEQQKIPTGDQFEEMRLVRIDLKVKANERDIYGPDVHVDVAFFDRDLKTDTVKKTRAVAPEQPLRLDGELDSNAERSVTAAYVVPTGFRAKEQTAQGETCRFAGYAIRVTYQGVLQDEYARPKDLLDIPIRPPTLSTP